MEQQRGALFIVSGPSGVGKTTVVTEFLRRHHADFKVSRMVTYTTKTPRSTEVHGVDYHFISHAEFERKIADDFFLEWSGEYGACYGTPRHVLRDIETGHSYVLVIDRVGAAQIIQEYPRVVLVWIQVSSHDMLSTRLAIRKTESLEQIEARLLLAKKEIEQERHVPMYHYHITNDELSVAIEGLSAVIIPRCIPVGSDIV